MTTIHVDIEPHCRNCRFWEEFKEEGRGVCNEITENSYRGDEYEEIEKSPAYAPDGLYTKPDFGCILFQGK